jgi:predicted metal-dependent peptidase
MTQIVTVSDLEDPSLVLPGAPSTNPVDDKPKTWEAIALKPLVEEIFRKDPRFVGLSRFIINVRIFWSFEIPTACAGHGFIFFNPDWWDHLPEETRKTVLVHEVYHLILKHLQRGEGLDPMIHNEACDHVINLGIEKDGFTFVDWDALKDPVYVGKSAEQIYNIIWEEREKNPPKPQPNTPSKDQIEQLIKDQLVNDTAAGGKTKTLQQQKEEAEQNVDDAQKTVGNTPGQKFIRLDMTKVKVKIQRATYNQIFKKYLTDPLTGGKRTFMRPSRRSHGQPNKLLTPGRFPKRGHKNRLTHLVYALDVSGSITLQQAQQFHDSVRTIKELLNPEKLTVLLFDTRIVFEKTFTDKEKYGNINVYAGGGTDLKDVYKRMRVLGAEAMVCFTDLCVSIPPQPEWESIWIVPNMNCPIPVGLYGDVYLIPQL